MTTALCNGVRMLKDELLHAWGSRRGHFARENWALCFMCCKGRSPDRSSVSLGSHLDRYDTDRPNVS
jgi:hypothetical protein